MDAVYLSGLGASMAGVGQAQAGAAEAKNVAYQGRNEIRDLRHQVERLSLLNQAMWELIRERAHLTDADIEAKAKEIDLRDGIEDGQMTATAVKCPSCGRVSNRKHYRCIYCSQEFERAVFG